MHKTMEITRRSFMKIAGTTAAVCMAGTGFVKQAWAASMDFVGLRQASVYNADANIYAIRKSQDNPMVIKLYAEDGFLSEGPCGHRSHQLLHTHYYDRSANIAALKASGIELKL